MKPPQQTNIQRNVVRQPFNGPRHIHPRQNGQIAGRLSGTPRAAPRGQVRAQYTVKPMGMNGFFNIVVHTGHAAALLFFRLGAGKHGNDGQIAAPRTQPQQTGDFIPIEARHPRGHQNDIDRRRMVDVRRKHTDDLQAVIGRQHKGSGLG